MIDSISSKVMALCLRFFRMAMTELGSVPTMMVANKIESAKSILKTSLVIAEIITISRTIKIPVTLKAGAVTTLRLLRFNLDVESKTIMIKAMIATEVRKSGEKLMMGFPPKRIKEMPMPAKIRIRTLET